MNLARWTQPSGPLCLWQCFIGYFPNKLFSRARVFQCTPIKVLKVPIKVFWFVSFLTTIHLCQMYPVSSCLVHIGPKGQDLLLSWPFQIYNSVLAEHISNLGLEKKLGQDTRWPTMVWELKSFKFNIARFDLISFGPYNVKLMLTHFLASK